jgi:hypothetical protein
MAVKDILRVLYAPHKVFKDIVQKPGYIGPLILLIIFVLAQVGSSYVIGSKSYIEQVMPTGEEGDQWTDNATLWRANSGVMITNNYVDFINSTASIVGFPNYYGNSSVEFTIGDNSTLKMILSSFGGQVNCGVDGFPEMSFRAKIVTPETTPENVTLILHSLTDSNYFYRDLTGSFSNNLVNVWNNITLEVGNGNWVSVGNGNWENITGLSLTFNWSNNSNINVLIDGLFFRGIFKNQLELYGDLTYIGNSAINGFAPFLFEWLLLTGLMYLLIKGLKGNVIWRPLMIAIGYALVALVIQAFIVAVVYTTLPNLHYPLEVLSFVPGESQAAYDALIAEISPVNTAGYVIQAATYIWIVALGMFVTRAVTSDKHIAEHVSIGKTPSDVTSDGKGLSWMKCLLVSGAGLFLTIIILGFLGV